eukprot:142686_1
MSHNNTFRARKYKHSSSRSTSNYNGDNSHDKILWNTCSPSLLLESMPSISSSSSNYDAGFLKQLNIINKLITWLENESDIFDRSLLNQYKFNKIKNEIDNVNNCISNGFSDCNNLIKNNQISYNNYSKFKARLQNIKNQFDTINKQINRSIYKLNRSFSQQNAKKSLLESANRATYAQADEQQSLKSSIELVNNALDTIKNIKDEMFYQSDLLTKTKGQLLKFINLTGFSGSIIRVISQRSKMDFYIFIIGCFITLTVIFLLWYYF